ncbi:hypothetical protein V5O48_014765 [Marasmius crinis-equi]|uniref:Ribonuclease H1 N-terminal domain-containing protein n=1 Tax=Marasmius crinis-equi TaxID=585013 RepID=A0ABR3EWE6_9AGAR
MLPGGPSETPKVFSSCRTDVDRATTFVKTAVEHHRGWVITTTTKVQRIHPDRWEEHLAAAEECLLDASSTPAQTPQAVLTQLPLGGLVEQAPASVTSHPTGGFFTSISDDRATDIHLSDASTFDFTDLSDVGGNGEGETGDGDGPPIATGANSFASSSVMANLFHGVPHPTLLRRPVDDSTSIKYYVVFVGRQVGIVRDDWPLVRRLVDGVSGGAQQRYNSYDKALLNYYRAWKGTHPNGWTPKHVPAATETRDELAELDLDFDALDL